MAEMVSDKYIWLIYTNDFIMKSDNNEKIVLLLRENIFVAGHVLKDVFIMLHFEWYCFFLYRCNNLWNFLGGGNNMQKILK